ncbi:MAG: DUF1284 domain-containing protein [Thermodesulfovibrionales bacterium]|nr:DUF1284 domain-containing protein [Thermodesulfovibrionales bacterium]
MLTLRGHHLICLHFFSGEGYDSSFIENLMDVLKRAENEKIEIAATADNICAKCPYLKNDKCAYDEKADAEIREMDETALRLLNLSTGQKITWQAVKEYIPIVFHEWHNRYCNDCDWKQACEKSGLYREMKMR